MAKTNYNIRSSIDRSWLDQEIVLDFFKIPMRPLPLKTLGWWIVTVAFICFSLFVSPAQYMGWFGKLLMIIWIVAAGAYFGTRTDANRLRITEIVGLMEFYKRGYRVMSTRSRDNPVPFLNMVGIRDIEANGLIRFLDGSVGQMYSVVGSASMLLFNYDKALILNRVSAFFRKVIQPPEWAFLTTMEPQRVYRQVAALERRNSRMRYRHVGLDACMAEDLDMLQGFAGTNYESLHQYLLIKAPSMSTLKAAHRQLRNEVQSSSLMYRECEKLMADDTVETLSVLFKDRDELKHDRQSRQISAQKAREVREKARRTSRRRTDALADRKSVEAAALADARQAPVLDTAGLLGDTGSSGSDTPDGEGYVRDKWTNRLVKTGD